MEPFGSVELKQWSGATERQAVSWSIRGLIGSGYQDRRTGLMVEPGGTGYSRVYDALDLSVARVLVEVGLVEGRGSARYGEIAAALRGLPLDRWPGRTLVVRAGGAAVVSASTIAAATCQQAAALVVDLGACAYGEGSGLAAVV